MVIYLCNKFNNYKVKDIVNLYPTYSYFHDIYYLPNIIIILRLSKLYF